MIYRKIINDRIMGAESFSLIVGIIQLFIGMLNLIEYVFSFGLSGIIERILLMMPGIAIMLAYFMIRISRSRHSSLMNPPEQDVT